MNRDNLLVSFLLILIVGAIYFFSRAVEEVLFPDSSTPLPSVQTAPDPKLAPVLPPKPPSPEEKEARRALREGHILKGTAGDKLLNFLLSGKRDFSRELYELKYNQFDAQQDPSDSLRMELEQLAQILQAYRELELSIAAHTDGSGKRKNQADRSQKQADQIKAFLVSKGVSANRMKAIGYGDNYPIADGNTAPGRKMNQRIELIISRL